MIVTKTKLLDFVERVGWTAVQAFAGAIMGLQLTTGIHWSSVLASAGFAALVASLKVIVAQNVGFTTSGSLPETAAPIVTVTPPPAVVVSVPPAVVTPTPPAA